MSAPTARRFEVAQRRRPDPMSISSPGDFAYRRGEAVAADVVIDDPQTTLYCIDRRRGEAIFVETPSNVDIAAAPFYYQAQFAHARRAIVMPLAEFHAMADAKGERFRRAILIHSVGRCGSTLLSKMFGSLPQCLSLSEPDVQTQLIAEPFARENLVSLLRSSARHYFQPRGAATHLVLKFRSFCIELAQPMQQATPNSTSLFLYRDIERVIVSGMQAFRYRGAPLDVLDRLHRSALGVPLLAAGLAWNRALGEKLFPVTARFTSWEKARMGAVGILAMAWVSAMERCVKLQADGLPIVPIHYNDLIARPAEIATQLLVEHCQLSADLVPQLLAPLGQDSQAGSVIERSRQQCYELTPRDRQIMGDVLARSDIIDSGDFRVPGTLGSAGT